MQTQVILSSDSPAEMPRGMHQRLGVGLVPLYVNVHEQSLRDGVEITAADVFALYNREKTIPATSSVSVGDYTAHFSKTLEDAQGPAEIVHFCIGGLISSSYNNACIAAEEFPGVFIVDSESISAGLSIQLLHADALRAQGLGAAAIAEEANAFRKKVRTAVLLGSPTFLARGGRCSALSALGANLLGIRPVVQMVDGKTGVYKKLRGRAAQVHELYIGDLLARPEEIDGTVAFLCHTGLPPEELFAAEDCVRSFGLFKELHICLAGAITGTHLGERSMMLCFAGK